MAAIIAAESPVSYLRLATTLGYRYPWNVPCSLTVGHLRQRGIADLRVVRIYTGSDGESHIEDLDPDVAPDFQSPRVATKVSLTRMPQGRYLDFHPAPERRWSVNIAGEMEIGLGDGSFHRFGVGDLRLMEDTTGRGHNTRALQDTAWLMVTVDSELTVDGPDRLA